ncbi:MAG: photosynthetic protein synthase I [Gammaproteobacteria bacterium]|nr:MAG: photosynthetic protein synthase I [Gammaproteobacteria bacterium]RLA51475.1 MAG: photosynthetic protein synthase I [Gammaproteobacteria bacterium]
MALCTAVLLLCSETAYADAQILAPGYRSLEFPAPDPNTYTLPVLGDAADGEVINTDGESLKLHDLFDGHIVLLSFIYATCDDINGCPLATAVLHKIKRRIAEQHNLTTTLRMITISFDPQHDTPEVMQRYGKGFQSDTLDWQFLTTSGDDTLQPILNDYAQTVSKVFDKDGKDAGRFSHILRVFLIDRDQKIRNIYSTSYLHADTLISDIKTVQIEDAASSASLTNTKAADQDKADLTSSNASPSISRWSGKSLLGLPPPPVPDKNPITAAAINLGQKLFFDRRLSLNNTMSCAMCHVPEQGFTNNQMATAVGIEGSSVRRNAPTLYNVAYLERLFHDGREYALEQQVWGPLLAPNEMANPSVGFVIRKLNLLADYKGLFEAAYQSSATMETVGMALASYQRTLTSADSSFDQWYFGKQNNALNPGARAGFELFVGKGGCSSCHLVSEEYALFTDSGLHNTGLGYQTAMQASPLTTTSLTTRVQIAPGQFVEVNNSIIASVSGPRQNDLGLYEITQSPQDRWKYRTPSLRNIALTAPYMHDGSLTTLEDVVEFYNRGGFPNDNQDPRIHPLKLSKKEKINLVRFMESLTGSNVAALVADTMQASIGDPE